MCIVFGLGFTFLVMASFLLDWIFVYPICEICLLQRFIMLLLVVFSLIGGLTINRIPVVGYVSFVAIGLLVGLGLAFALSHLYMLQQVLPGEVNACKIVSEMTFMPDFWYDFFHERYAFVPCDQVKSTFLGLGFPLWSMLIYAVAGFAYAGVVYYVVCRYLKYPAIERFKSSEVFAWVKCFMWFVLVLFFCVWLAAGVYMVSNQRKILYKPDRYGAQHEEILQRVDTLDYQIGAGNQHAFSYPVKKLKGARKPTKLWIVLSGRESLALDGFLTEGAWRGLFDQFSPSSSFLLVDYPGFGMNDGFPASRSNRDTVLEAYRVWRQHHGLSEDDPCQVFVLAHSMGTGVAVDVAALLPNLRGLVLLSPFVSIFQMSKALFGTWMAWTVWPFLLDRYPTADRLGGLHEQLPHVPVVIFHGDQDGVIPVDQSQQMVKANRWIRYYELAGRGHEKSGFVDERLISVMTDLM